MSAHDVNSFDYKEAFHGNGPAYIGSLKSKCCIAHMIHTMNTTGQFIGVVFNAERLGRGDDCKWTYEKNLNFMAGIIAAKRPVILVTHIDKYNHPKNRVGISHHEMMWLWENGYTPEIDSYSIERTLFTPPVKLLEIKLSKYIDDDGQIMIGNPDWETGISRGYRDFIYKNIDMVEHIIYGKIGEYEKRTNWRRKE